MGMFDSIFFENRPRLLVRLFEKGLSLDFSKIEFQTKDFNNNLSLFYINKDGYVVIDDHKVGRKFLPDFSGKFEVHSFSNDIWSSFFVVVKNGKFEDIGCLEFTPTHFKLKNIDKSWENWEECHLSFKMKKYLEQNGNILDF